MYCPNCGQQQMSGEMRYCSRCGLALSGLAEWLTGGRLPFRPVDEAQVPAPMTPRRKAIRKAAKLMFFSAVLFPICLMFSAAIEEGVPMILPFGLFFVALVWMLYARLFGDATVPVKNLAASQTSTLGSPSARGALPPANTTAIPGVGRQQVRTSELAQPPSVTEHTTRLLDNE